MNSRDLQINEVTISTVSVDIQVMRIGTKQMTLAVFRQLPSKDIFDKWGNLLATPWGWVNYDWQGGKPFVFSYEGILYRAGVPIDAHYALTVEREVSEETYPRKPTGKWRIQTSEAAGIWFRLKWRFDSDAAARAHLENRQRSIVILEAAPQLFIAV